VESGREPGRWSGRTARRRAGRFGRYSITSESGSTPEPLSVTRAASSGRPAVTRFVSILNRGRRHVVDPRAEDVGAGERAPREDVAAGVDGQVVALLAREDDACDPDVQPVARGQHVRVDRGSGVPLHVVFVAGAEEPWLDQRAGRGADDRRADIRRGLVRVHVIELLATALGRLGPAVGRRGGPNGLVGKRY